MKARESRTKSFCAAIAAGFLGATAVLAQSASPSGPPLPPGAAGQNHQGWVVRRAAPTNPVANPFALPGTPPQRGPLPPPIAPAAPLAQQQPQAPAPVRPFPGNFPQLAPAAAMPPVDPNALKFDAELKEYTSKPGESSAPFTFWLTNVSSSDVLINNIRTSCGCTAAKLPSQPWRLAPGGSGPIEVSMNLAGKGGSLAKGVTIESSVGIKMLTVKANITPPAAMAGAGAGAMNDGERLKNMQLALADRQVVFKNQDCAKCHADPARGQTTGVAIYNGVCAVCHDSHLRAALVPDLKNLNHPTDAEHWRKWIAHGRAGSMMPAFAQSEGGPLNQQQMDALVEYVVQRFPSRAPKAGAQNGTAAQAISTFPAPAAN